VPHINALLQAVSSELVNNEIQMPSVHSADRIGSLFRSELCCPGVRKGLRSPLSPLLLQLR